jgi:hypothetical protein
MSANELMDLADKARLELSLQTRENIIRQLTANGCIPKELEDRDLLMKALDGMDRTVLTKAKIKSDDTAAQSQAAHAKLIAQALLHTGSRHQGKRTTPVELEDVTVVDMVEGETHIGVQTIKHTDILAQNPSV